MGDLLQLIDDFGNAAARWGQNNCGCHIGVMSEVSQEAMQSLRERVRKSVGQLQKLEGTDDPENRCDRCGGRNLHCWSADSDLWNRVAGDHSILCPICFAELAAAAGVESALWRLKLEGDNPEISKLRVKLHDQLEQLAKDQVEIKELRQRCDNHQGSRDFAIDRLANALSVKANKVHPTMEYYVRKAAEKIKQQQEENSEIWDAVVQACKQAWPDQTDLVWNESPVELILRLIDERDDLARALFRIRRLTMRGRGEQRIAKIAIEAVLHIDEGPLFPTQAADAAGEKGYEADPCLACVLKGACDERDDEVCLADVKAAEARVAETAKEKNNAIPP